MYLVRNTVSTCIFCTGGAGTAVYVHCVYRNGSAHLGGQYGQNAGPASEVQHAPVPHQSPGVELQQKLNHQTGCGMMSGPERHIGFNYQSVGDLWQNRDHAVLSRRTHATAFSLCNHNG